MVTKGMADKINEEQSVEMEKPRHPVDHGYAWVIMAASIFSNFFVVGTMKVFGIFYAEFIREYEASAIAASLLQLTQPIVYSICCIFVSTFGMTLLSCRQGAVIGGLLLNLSLFLSSFANNIYVLVFTYSFLQGVATAFAFSALMVVLSLYFNKRRGMAIGFMMASGSFGGLVMVPLIRGLIEEYTLSGSLLVFSGVCCNIVVAGLLFRPPSFYNRRSRTVDCETVKSETTGESKSESFRMVLHKKWKEEFKEMSSEVTRSEPLLYNSFHEKHDIGNTDDRTGERHQSTTGLHNSKINMNGDVKAVHSHKVVLLPVGQFASLHSVNISFDARDKELNSMDNSGHISIPKTSCARYFNPQILKNGAFLRLLMAYSFGSVGNMLPLYYIPIFAQERGIDVRSGDVLLVIAGAADVVGRALSGLMSDKIPFKKQYFIAVGLTLSCISQAFIELYTTYSKLVVFSILYSLFGAVLMGTYASTLLDIIDLKDFKSAICVLWLAQGITTGVSSPIIGLIRDTTGSYTACFYFFSATLFFSSLFLWAEMASCQKSNKK